MAVKRGDLVKVEGVSDPTNPDTALYESDELLGRAGEGMSFRLCNVTCRSGVLPWFAILRAR